MAIARQLQGDFKEIAERRNCKAIAQRLKSDCKAIKAIAK
jgi:hypothetical protein